MAIDKAAILNQAQQYSGRGQYDKAILEWQKLITNTSADASIHNAIGDLHAKRRASPQAVEAYFQAAAYFTANQDPLKAIAVYRKILKLEPHRYAVYQKLGDLNADRGLVNSAIAEYTTLCKLLLKEGRTRDALQVYRTMAKVDPANLEVKQRIAELCEKENQRDEAVEAYLELGRECRQQRRREQARAAYAAAAKLDPANAKVKEAIEALDKPAGAVSEDRPATGGPGHGRQSLLDAAGRQIEAGQYGDAETGLMEMLSREPGDPEVCRLLARLHLRRGEMSVAMGEFQFLAGAAMRAEDYDLAEAMLMEYLAVDPECALLMESLGQVYERKGDVTGAVQRYSQGLSMLLERPDPDQPTLPQDLLAKIRELAPNSDLVARFTELLRGGTPQPVAPEFKAAEPVEAATKQRESLSQAGPTPVTEAPEMDIAVEAVRVSKGRVDGPETPAVAEPETATELHDEPTVTGTPEPEPQPLTEPEPASVPEPEVVAEADAQASLAPAPQSQPEPEPTAIQESVVITEQSLPEPIPAPLETPAGAVPEPTVEPELEPDPMPVETKAASQSEPDPQHIRARYDLGVAYKHMGLFDEALEELRQTVLVKEYFVDSCWMIADCFRDQGDYQTAIAHYEQALAAALDDEERASPIRYELGVLYEAEGQLEKAVQTLAGLEDYRDVEERLERIKAEQTAEPAPEPVLSAADSAPPRKRKKRRDF